MPVKSIPIVKAEKCGGKPVATIFPYIEGNVLRFAADNYWDTQYTFSSSTVSWSLLHRQISGTLIPPPTQADSLSKLMLCFYCFRLGLRLHD